MKKIFPLLAIFFMICTSVAHANAQVTFDYEVIAKSDNPILAPGDQAIIWTTLENTGNSMWYADWTDQQFCGNGWCDTPDPIRLGTIRPHDRSSDFFTANNWVSPNRTHAADQDRVGPGEKIDFGFYISVPANKAQGMYTECFAPVIENMTWMADKDLCWNITVDGTAKSYNAHIEHIIGGSYKKLLLEPGQEEIVSYQLKNTGSTTWYQDGQYPIHLANTDDQSSELYQPTWLSPNRPAKLVETSVAPGEIGTFQFSVKAPTNAQIGDEITQKMWLVAENYSWFDHTSLDPYIVCEVEIIESKENQDMVYDMLNKMATQESMSVDLNFFNSNGQNQIELNANMQIDTIDPEKSVTNSIFNLKLDDSISKENYDFGMEMRQYGEDLSYIKLDVADLEKLGITELDKIDQQWIKIDQNEIREQYQDSFADFEDLYLISEEVDELDPIEEEKMLNAVKYSGAIVVLEDLGTEDINGHSSKRLSVKFNENVFRKAITMEKLYNTPMYEVYNIYETIHYADIWIGNNDNMLYSIIVSDNTLEEINSIEISLDDFGQRFQFVEPDEYITIDDLEEIYNSVMSASPTIQSAMESIAQR